MDTDLRKEVIESHDSDVFKKALEEFDIDPVFGVLHVNGFTEIDKIHAYGVIWAVERLKALEKENTNLQESIKELNSEIAILSS